MGVKDKRALQDVYLFIVSTFIELSCGCGFAVKAPNQDSCSLKRLIFYEKFAESISETALPTFRVFIWGYINISTLWQRNIWTY